MANERILQAIAVTAQIMGKEFTEEAARVYAEDLSDYPEQFVLQALARCRRELRSFPTIADVLARIEDGRPGAEEAWAMIPMTEHQSVVWTEEMREAFGEIRELLERDETAARMAFRETYLKLLSNARASRRPVKWEPSLGLDKSTHEPALRKAVDRGRITREHADSLLVDSKPPEYLQISGGADQELTLVDPKEMLARIRQQISKGQAS